MGGGNSKHAFIQYEEAVKRGEAYKLKVCCRTDLKLFTTAVRELFDIRTAALWQSLCKTALTVKSFGSKAICWLQNMHDAHLINRFK